MRAIIVADGDRPTRAALDSAWPGWDADVGLVVAADGGAATARSLGLPIDVLVGDVDSIAPGEMERVAATGATVALASDRSAPGATGKTAVAVPAAAQTTWNRPRSGSMITRTGRLWPMA